MKVVISLVILTATLGTVQANGLKVIYGDDNRVNPADSTNQLHVQLSRSTAVQINLKSRYGTRTGNLTLNGTEYKLKDKTLQTGMNVCASEPFSQQNALGNCSGFLVAPDLLVTAGHCVPSQSQCDNALWVFDYRNEKIGNLSIDKSNVYKCVKIVNQELNSTTKADYALIQLDRKVTDRKPLKFRTSGKVSTGTDLVVIGHPSGLPTKISAGASVRKNTQDQYFVSDLDTYGGNSGSAVFDAKTGQIEGILVRGAKDYVRSPKGCYVSNVCKNMGTPGCGGESVSRIMKVNIPRYSLGKN
ncbi:MAG: trypsin-like peptidase domain-containing protein [Bacteriovoracaceae bacterium]|nr:trypsin-like peptidase domain-containing protein [Bacteriovoracaceae bacterium]